MKMNSLLAVFSLAAVLALAASPVFAKVTSKTISYSDGDLALEGYLAWDDATAGKRPGVLVVHEWWGLNDYARKRADMLAEMGYVAFALDMYGKGKLTTHPEEAREWATAIRQNQDAWRKRANAGLAILLKQDKVDTSRIAAMGYCFGGSTSLQLAYAGADLKAVVTFHAALPAYAPDAGKPIRASILVCHGADDPFIPPEQIEAFKKSLTEAKADWHMVSFGGARHSFTVPTADKVGIDGMRYDEKADKRSWALMKSFLKECFGEKG